MSYEFNAASFMPGMFGQNVFCGGRFSQVMNERGEAHVGVFR